VERIGLIATTEVEFRNGNGSLRIPLFVSGVGNKHAILANTQVRC
jgi:hypothetical protein